MSEMRTRKSIISVIIPVYNAGQSIRRCLESVIEQNVQKEIICIDDGSQDNSLDILHEYKRDYPNIFVIISQKNQGAGAARNAGIEVAKGEYLAFMDSDDCYPNISTLKKLYDAAIRNNVLVSGGNIAVCTETGKLNEFGKIFRRDEVINYSDFQDMYCYTRYIYSADLFESDIRFPSYKRFQDPPFLIKLLLKTGKIATIPDVVYCYIKSDKKKTFSYEACVDMLEGAKECMLLAKKNNLELLYKNSLVNLLINLLPYYCKYAYWNDEKIWESIYEIENIDQEWHGEPGWNINPRQLHGLIDEGLLFKAEINQIIEDNIPVILYGAGYCGQKIYEKYFSKYPALLGFAISDKEQIKDSFVDGYAVKCIEDYRGASDTAVVIICIIDSKTKKDIYCSLHQKNYKTISSWNFDMKWLDQVEYWKT